MLTSPLLRSRSLGFASVLLGALALACSSAACSQHDVSSSDLGSPAGPIAGDGEVAGHGGSSGSEAAATPGASASDGAMASGHTSSSGGSSSGGGNGAVPVNILTAGTWDDNRNFDFFQQYRSTLQGVGGLVPISDAEYLAAHGVAPPSAKQTLDISLVIDTTGSMGDEISYLQSEFASLISTIQQKHPNAQQHWSLVLYRDTSDDYVVRWYDFRADPSELEEKLAAAAAGGGGDEPEAPDQALDVATRLGWRSDANTAKVLFWIADAPHHPEKADAMANVLRTSRDKGIHIYPIAASGTSPAAEAVMRSAAQLTGGRYVFLTDDSGVGNAHAEPHIPCYYVTKLNRAILRMVDIEVSGVYAEPESADILRTTGSPDHGVCPISTGTVQIY